ncbi:hypothetical protein HAX54_034733, partial [Datura stramonium]|nr:hypothetical protein [Datura stramonium]
MEVYQLTEPEVVGFEVHRSTNQDDLDDFSSTPPVLWNKRPNQDVGASSPKPSKQSKSEVVYKQTPKKIINKKRFSTAKKHKHAQLANKPSKKTVKPKSHTVTEEKAEASQSEPDK